MKPLRTGMLLVTGVVVGRAVARKVSARRASPHGDARWFTVTVDASCDQLAGDERLSEALNGLGSGVETRIVAAPGDRGAKIAVRVREDGTGSAPSADGLRRALRDAKSLIETGEVVRRSRARSSATTRT